MFASVMGGPGFARATILSNSGRLFLYSAQWSRSQFPMEALAAIAATLPDGRVADRRPDGKGGYRITLPHDVLNKLNYVRGPGQSYSDVILALVKAE
jgi:hypothetical protein